MFLPFFSSFDLPSTLTFETEKNVKVSRNPTNATDLQRQSARADNLHLAAGSAKAAADEVKARRRAVAQPRRR